LNQYQLFSFIKSLNLEVEYPDPDMLQDDVTFMKSLIYAYIKFGLPLIAALRLRKSKGKDDHHVALITGFKLDHTNYENKADSIIQLYVHDDQVGPYCTVSFSRSIKNWDYPLKNAGNFSSIEMEELFVPIYHKIRLPFIRLYRSVKRIYSSYQKVVADIEQYEVFLTTINRYKKEILEYSSGIMNVEENRIPLFTNSPNYIWIVRFYLGANDTIDLVYDATNPFMIPIHQIYLIRDEEKTNRVRNALKERFDN